MNDNPPPITNVLLHPAKLWLAGIEADGIETVRVHKPRRTRK